MAEVAVRLVTRADRGLADHEMRAAVRHATGILAVNRLTALGELDDPDTVRDEARSIRRRAIDSLDEMLDAWSERATANGIVVHRARTAADAVRVVLDLAAAAAAAGSTPARIAKGKSMASEEVHLNVAIEAAGHEVIETDLGEFIIQLAGEAPSHLIVPAIHKSRFDVAELFTADAGHPISPLIEDEAAYARARLRQAFLEADIGVTGVNFAIAETGSICLVENEGNGRMCTSLPRTHVAIMGMERIVETWAELDVMLSVLARSATGQALSVYTNIINGPRRSAELDGPDAVHVIVLDNGRSTVVGTEFDDALLCIRCGACLNVCPVYRNIGGHAYGSVYSGPIGAVLTSLLLPDDASARELPEASSLCGACAEVCPVRIPLHDLLLRERHRDARADATRTRRLGFALWSHAWSRPFTYRMSVRAIRTALRIAARFPSVVRHTPGWAGAWARDRAVPEARR